MAGTGKKKSPSSGKKVVSLKTSRGVKKKSAVKKTNRSVSKKKTSSGTKRTSVSKTSRVKKTTPALSRRSSGKKSAVKTKSTKIKQKVSVKKIVKNNMVDIVTPGTSPETLHSLSHEADTAAGNLMEHMDNIIGLPPLPGKDNAKNAVKDSIESQGKKQKSNGVSISSTSSSDSPELIITKEKLETHKVSFFNSLLGKKPKKQRPSESLSGDGETPEKIKQALAEDAKINEVLHANSASQTVESVGSSLPESLPPLPKLSKKELKAWKARTEQKIDSVTKNTDSISPANISKPNPQTSLEKPFEPIKERAKIKQEALDAEAKKRVPKALPPADESFKLEPKKSFFAKLFGGKTSSAKKASTKKQSTNNKPETIPGKISSKTVVDLSTLPKIVSGDSVTETIEVPKKNDFKTTPSKEVDTSLKDSKSSTISKTSENLKPSSSDEHELVDSKTLPSIADGNGSPEVEEHPNAEDFESQNMNNTQERETEQTVQNESVDETSEGGLKPDSREAMEEAILADQRMPTLHSESETSSEPEDSKTGSHSNSTSDSDGSNKIIKQKSSASNLTSTSDPKRYEHVLKISISKLEHKRDLLESSVKALEMEYAQKKRSLEQTLKEMESKINDIATREKALDVREKELLERENVLLTLQSDMIAERKELDEREFKLFIKEEQLQVQIPKSPLLAIKPDLVRMKTGLSNERRRIEEFLNQVRKLVLDKKLDDAKVLYDQMVSEFKSLQLPKNEVTELALAIKEVYNDITVAASEKNNG